MDIAVYSAKSYDRQFMDAAAGHHTLHYIEARLNPDTAMLARGSRAVCAFVNDQINETVLIQLKSVGVAVVALRAAGYNNVDLEAAQQLGITVASVPS